MSHIEVFILNYNGSSYLNECLDSLQNLNLESNSCVINVVDNASNDNSKEVVKSYKNVNFIELDKNYGFSEGNNRGVWKRLEQLKSIGQTPDYLCFLNNDTKVDKNWLIESVKILNCDPKIGALGVKSIFMDSFVRIQTRHNLNTNIRIKKNWSVKNIHSNPKRSKWHSFGAMIQNSDHYLPKKEVFGFLAVEDPQKNLTLNFEIENLDLKNNCAFEIQLNDSSYQINIPSNSTVKFQKDIYPNDFLNLIQNAGSFVTDSWQAGDRGAFEIDNQKFNLSEQVAAICGVSMFVPTKIFEKLKGFDPNYFAYFEDTDLSLRIQMLGFKCWYAADSKIKHIHCGSGGEFSHYFNFNVTYSHILFCSRWMESKEFWRKLYWLYRYAWRELKIFANDNDLESKPNLRAAMRLLKRIWVIPQNRIYRMINLSKIKDFAQLQIPAIS
jgi:GT2 family glycosyltransferase